jgi:peptidoglycan hydrolase-like protein with peptidoglycan-binding domain
MRGDDVAKVQLALQTFGRDVPRAERANRVMGASTVALLKALQTDLGLPTTGIVDPETVRAINVNLASLVTDQRVVRGSVRDANSNPFTDGSVETFNKGGTGSSPSGDESWILLRLQTLL